jgi:undecaprenyl-diphosphatase
MQQLLTYDRQFFKLINGKWHNDLFDWLMPWLRNSNMWVPLYLFLLLLIVINFKKQGWILVLFGAVTAIATDFVSSTVIKNCIFRLRTCHDDALAGSIRVLVSYCPESSSFTSSHAANHFALAMFLYSTLKNRLGKWTALFFAWALAISYAQVYVGVHYPLDITGGALIGILIGYLCGKLFNRNYSLA